MVSKASRPSRTSVRRASEILSCGLPDGLSNSCTLPVAQGDHLRVFIELRSHGARGPRSRVRLNTPDGMVIVESTTQPLFDGARFLLSKGITGKIELWDSTRAFPRMRGDIERLAGLTVSEGQNGIALRRYVERTVRGDFKDGGCQGGQNEIGRPESVLQAEDEIDISISSKGAA